MIWSFVNSSAHIQKKLVENQNINVPTFAYNAHHSGSIYSKLGPDEFIKLKRKSLSETNQALKHMPLILQFEGKELLIFGTLNSKLNAYDLKSRALYWSLQDLYITNTPVIDTDKKLIYARTEDEILSITASGKIVSRNRIDYSKLLPEGYSSKVFCNTALGLYKKNDETHIFWGCSAEMSDEKDTDYEILQGHSGFLISMRFQNDGSKLLSHQVFMTSKKTSFPFTGFHTGVWNTGSGPALFGGNKLFVATGNGSASPEHENWGCSVLLLNVEDFSYYNKSSTNFYSMDDKGNNDCFFYNLDMASSSVAVIEDNDKFYGVISGKPSKLVLLDPDKLPGNDPFRKNEVSLAGGLYYGQPNVFKTHLEKKRIVVAGQVQRRPQRTFISTKDQFDKMPNSLKENYSLKTCLGYIPKKNSSETVKHSLLYSGNKLKQIILAPENLLEYFTNIKVNANNKEFEQTIRAPGFSPPYAKLMGTTELNLPSKNFEFDSEKYELKNALDLEDLEEHRNYYMNRITETSNPEILYLSPKIGVCDYQTNEDLSKLFLYETSLDKEKEYRWVVSSYLIENGKLIKDWSFHPKSEDELPNSNIASTYGEFGGMTVVSSKQFLYLLDNSTGSLIAKKPLKNAPHFSMPLIYKDHIFLPTPVGMEIFQIEKSVLKAIQKKIFK